jgi:hypothetical protein
MAIDRRLYEKYSGRTGDPHARLGEALAKSNAERSAARDRLDRSFSERYISSRFKVRAIISIVGALIAFGVVVWSKI